MTICMLMLWTYLHCTVAVRYIHNMRTCCGPDVFVDIRTCEGDYLNVVDLYTLLQHAWRLYMYVCVWLYMCVCVCVCVCLWF
jgi:hypothetical protein